MLDIWNDPLVAAERVSLYMLNYQGFSHSPFFFLDLFLKRLSGLSFLKIERWWIGEVGGGQQLLKSTMD